MSAVSARSPAMHLTGCNILITRPAHQADSLSRALQGAGGNVIRFPTMEIVERVTDETRAVLERGLAGYDLAVFVSPNAVRHGVPVALETGGWPHDLMIAVVGPGSAAAINEQGLSVHVKPHTSTGAKALLAHAQLQAKMISGRRVIIFRGREGLPILGEELTVRGAVVTYAEVYAREMPVRDPGVLNARGVNGEIDIIVITSAKALRNLFALVGKAGEEWLRDTPFLVVSERIARLAGDYRLRHRSLIAHSASDQDIVKALLHWREA